METHLDATHLGPSAARTREHPVGVDVAPSIHGRRRLTTAFRVILALPHLLLVGGPMAFAVSYWMRGPDEPRLDIGAGTGVLGAVAAVIAIIAWFAILFTARFPQGLWNLAAFYLRWRVRAVAYVTLLRDEYPPFGDGNYPAALTLDPPAGDRNRLTVAFRPILAIPHLIVLWALGIAWAVTTLIAWGSILHFGDYPPTLYKFGVGVLRWSTRVEAYLLLLRDEYPPFSLE